MTRSLLKRPSALIPISMSAAALALVLIYAARFGVAPQPDEGAIAHTWQLLMAGQAPVIAFFAIRWIRTDIRQGLLVLALQIAAALSAAFPVWWFGW